MLRRFFAVSLFLGLVACQTTRSETPVAVNAPNPPFSGTLPEEFTKAFAGNSWVTSEIGKLPELQDGISRYEEAALVQMARWCERRKKRCDELFTEMDKYGIPKVRKFNTPLQTFFWAMESHDRWSLSSIAKADIDVESELELFIVDVWSGSLRKSETTWVDFDVVSDRLNSPKLLLFWMTKYIAYDYDSDPLCCAQTRYKSPKRVLSERNGDSLSQSAFSKRVLRKNGYDAYLMFVDMPDSSGHGLCFWYSETGIFHIETAWYGNKGLHGPYPSLKEIGAAQYRKLVFQNGKSAEHRLSTIGRMPTEVNWKLFVESHTRAAANLGFLPI